MSNMARKEINISDEEFERIVRSAAPPTADDCTITRDGRRLDTPEKLHAWLDELAQQRELDEQSDISL
jgi:hypothetical protein